MIFRSRYDTTQFRKKKKKLKIMYGFLPSKMPFLRIKFWIIACMTIIGPTCNYVNGLFVYFSANTREMEMVFSVIRQISYIWYNILFDEYSSNTRVVGTRLFAHRTCWLHKNVRRYKKWYCTKPNNTNDNIINTQTVTDCKNMFKRLISSLSMLKKKKLRSDVINSLGDT